MMYLCQGLGEGDGHSLKATFLPKDAHKNLKTSLPT